jgi:hypothetical protein
LQHWPNFPPKSRDDLHYHQRPRSLVWRSRRDGGLAVTVVSHIMIHDRIK